MDELILDPNSLYAIADVICGYCARQKELLDAYYSQIMTLESEWRDDETFGSIAQEINILKNNAIIALDEINETYPKYFREKAQQILARPTFNAVGAVEISGDVDISADAIGDSIRNSEKINNSTAKEKPKRTIPGIPGIVTGGDSTVLGKNIMSYMGVSRNLKWGLSGYQAHHIIPADFATHPVIQKIGMNIDDASNGVFLRTPNEGINAKTVHHGYHKEYNEAIKEYLDGLDISESVESLESKVAAMQQKLKSGLENGIPLYMKKENSTTRPVTYQHKGGGATSDMWGDVINALSDDEVSTFKEGEYVTYRLSEPLTVYRYFGSYSPKEMSGIDGKAVEEAEIMLNSIDDAGWGSAVGGRFLAENPNLTSEQAKDLLALNPKWGNNAAYIATIELPIGTRISTGKAAKQVCENGVILNGGETQIILHEEWTTEKIKKWVKSCKPISN